MDIGVIGLGHMGSAIARNLLSAGHRLTLWNRSPEKARPLVDAGAALAEHPADAADGDFVITMLADDRAVDAVVRGDGGLLSSAGGAVHVSMSTIGTPFAARLARAHAEAGRRFVSAPVFGRPDIALSGGLFIAAAGPPADLAACQPLFEEIGRRVFIVGAAPETANLVKLCGNFMMLSAIEAMAEAMALAERGGVAPATLLDILTGTQFDAPVYRNYGAILVERRFRPAGFPAPLALKDMDLVDDAAGAARVPMPVLGILRDHLLTAIARDGEDVDCTAIAESVAAAAGMADEAGAPRSRNAPARLAAV
ncbi:MAG: NAD(P)-dependent oxidoreductase [Alphaproteobacteria bacterium]|nr:NAD(P)-dependent oxidoreductase [Alphaproteobacteria bacterium]